MSPGLSCDQSSNCLHSDDTITGYVILRRDKDIHEEGTFETVEANTGTAGTTYTDTSVEPEKQYVYRIKAINAQGESEISSWVRAYTPAAPATENTPATGAPTIGGTARVGETLTVDTSGITDEDGLDDASFGYQWLAGDVEITGATNATYTLADADRGKAIKVRVSFTDDAGNEETLTSAATAAVAAKPNSQATGAPTISGTAQVGETLTADTAGISDEDGLENASFSYQWLAGGTDISGATGSSYILTADEEGLTIKVRVSFTDDAGNEESMTSAATAAVSGAEPTEPPPPADQPDGGGQRRRHRDPLMGCSRRRQCHGLPDTAPPPPDGRGHPAGVRGRHRQHGHNIHRHGSDRGGAPRVPGQGRQRRRPEPAVQLRPGGAIGRDFRRLHRRAMAARSRRTAEKAPGLQLGPRPQAIPSGPWKPRERCNRLPRAGGPAPRGT